MRASRTAVNEDRVREALQRDGFTVRCWSNEPHAVYAEHAHPYRKRLFVLDGSITFSMAGNDVVMKPGDHLDVSPQTAHSAVVGPDGVVCLEGQTRA